MKRLGIFALLNLSLALSPAGADEVRVAVAGTRFTCAVGRLALWSLRAGFVDGRPVAGSMWVVPTDLHSPIRQDAVLLATGRRRPAAEALPGYLRSDEARTIIWFLDYDF